MKWSAAVSAGEYNAIFGGPVCNDRSQRTRSLVERAAAEAATGFKNGNTLLGPRSHSPCAWKNKLPAEEVVTARTLTLPTTRLPCGPLSEMKVFCLLALLRQ